MLLLFHLAPASAHFTNPIPTPCLHLAHAQHLVSNTRDQWNTEPVLDAWWERKGLELQPFVFLVSNYSGCFLHPSNAAVPQHSFNSVLTMNHTISKFSVSARQLILALHLLT